MHEHGGRDPNPTLFRLHRQSWEQLDRYARGQDPTPRERLTGVVATYLAAMVRTDGSEGTARGLTKHASSQAVAAPGRGQPPPMATATDVGKAGLQGWREKVGHGVAGPVSFKTPLDEDHVKAAVGILFFVLAVVYIIAAIKEAAEHIRG